MSSDIAASAAVAATPRYADPYRYARRQTREVMVGAVGVGGSNPIRVQSMTTTRTQDVEGTVAQVRRLVDVGCEIVRITAPTVQDAKAIGEIARRLRQAGIRVPLVADIHFSPNAALEAAEHVDKVRINPGNYADSKTFAIREYTDDQYDAELERIRRRFAPLVEKCKARGISMRIGTNHGSLSDRIMNRFGDTPRGMVESALEFASICRDLDYHDLIFSMKASNPKVMIHAYRLLVAELDARGWRYPLHLGVTEAGGGEDGRVKSAIGIGSLLDDGLGDTIRVSLTEDPEAEVPVAFRLVAPYNAARREQDSRPATGGLPDARMLYEYARRTSASLEALGLGGVAPVAVVQRVEEVDRSLPPADLPPADLARESGADGALTLSVAGTIGGSEARLIEGDGEDFIAAVDRALALLPDEPAVVSLRLPDQSAIIRGYRLLAARLAERGRNDPIHLIAPAADDLEAARLATSVALGSLLCDGIGDSVEVPGSLPTEERRRLAFAVLQGTGARITRTEYVACPSCGRTLFDLQSTTERIQRSTGHLKGVKIAIMGCVVNGPGEMADADFGYVGGAPGQVNLYVGKEVVERGVPQDEADERLIDLIRRSGLWTDPTI